MIPREPDPKVRRDGRIPARKHAEAGAFNTVNEGPRRNRESKTALRGHNGVSGTLNVFGLKIGLQAGIAIDNKGNVAAYGQGSGPVVSTAINATKVIMGAPASTLTKGVDASPKPKAFEGLGVTSGVSNGSTVNDLGGQGSYQNVSAGDVVGGTLEHSSGNDSEKGRYEGVSVTVGEGAGGGVDAGSSYTQMSKSVNVPDVVLKPIVNTVDNMAKQAVDQVRKQNGG